MTTRASNRSPAPRRAFRLLFLALVLAPLLALAAPALAFDTVAREAILLDDETGAVLFEYDADAPAPPASMSKLMTVYLVFEALEEGRISMDDTFRVSEKAWRMGGSKMFVEVGSEVRVEDLLRGVIVQSGNDACIVLAEGLVGSEEAFAEQMNAKAKELGLTNSHFLNATGWPEEGHVMSVRDIATLSRHLIRNFPQYYPMFAEITFTYNGIKQGNRNPLLYKNMGVDGLKTGHTEASGYGLAASAARDGRRLIAVLHGLRDVNERSAESERLLDYGFREFNNYALFKAGETVIDAEVWLGDEATVPLVLADDLTVTLPRTNRPGLKVAVVYDGPIPAPIANGQEVAKLVVSVPDRPGMEVTLQAGAAVGELSAFARLGTAISYLLWGPPESAGAPEAGEAAAN